MESLSTAIVATLSTVSPSTKLLVIFLSSFLEGVPIIGSILPGGTIAIFAGTLAAKGILSPITTALLVALGSFLGDMLGFVAGKRFRKWRWVRALVDNEKHQKSWDLFDRHIALVAIFGKLIPGVRSTPALFAAARGIDIRRYALYSLVGSALWGFLGVYAGNVFQTYFGNNALMVLFVIVVVSIVFALGRIAYKEFKNRNRK